jgi:hypothetical protein
VPPHLIDEWPVWRIITAGMATLQEIDTHWTLIDVDNANDVLDLQQQLEEAGEKAR